MSSFLLRGVCKSCSILQRRNIKPTRSTRESWYQFHNNFYYQTSLRCYVTTTKDLCKSPTKAVLPDEEATTEAHDFCDVLIEPARDLWESMEHDVVDTTTFDLVKRHYLERMRELEEAADEDASNDGGMKKSGKKSKLVTKDLTALAVPKKNKRSTRHPAPAKYVRGNQLTYQSEQNVLAEIDIYVFLGDVMKAVNLFNYHRRHGHKFNVDAYNKIIHLWASENNWKNIQMLLKNMTKEGLEPNHQTYAGLLEVCGNLMDQIKTENILTEMETKNISIDDIFLKAVLTKQQIRSIVEGVSMLYPTTMEAFKACNESLHSLTSSNSTGHQINTSLVKQQIDSELIGTIKVKSIDVSKMNDTTTKKRAEQFETLMDQWKNDFMKELAIARNTRTTRAFLYNRCVTYSCVLTPEELTDIVFDEILPIICTQPQGIPVNFICRRLGHLIYNKFAAKYKEEKGVSEKIERIMTEYSSCDEWFDMSIHPRQKWKEISSKLPYLASEEVLPNTWPTKLRAMASSVLLDILKKVAVIDTKMFLKSDITKEEAALSHHHELNGNYRIGVLKFHPVVGKLYGSYLSQIGDLAFEVNKMPMLIPPRPWISSTSGAYLLLHTDLVRTITGQYKLNQLRSASEQGNLDKIYDSLNYLGNTAWKINEQILDVMIELFNGDGDMKLDIIGPNLPNIEKWKAKRTMTYQQRQSRQRKRKLYHELFALRMDLLYKLSIANHFRDDVFWIPSNLDFRGRAYPIAPHCSHIGSDVSRGLLLFAEGKKLGEKGVDWLKIHLVNLHGQLKKSSLDERIKYADDHLDDIFDSADNPLSGNKWWQDASDPWQTLVACIELTNALRSGDGENYVSRIPIQQDGSCNGLQHYASLGRDEYGAKQVNCIPSERPQDVYMEVANLVEKKRKYDAENDVEIAKQLEGKINRKVVKQTVMTVVYGVTFVGGRLQIEKQLKELDVESEIIFKASVYVVQEVFKSLTEMFTSARQIQDWLTDSAAQIALTGNCVDWVTPLGLPIIQPYHRQTTEAISTPLQIVASTHSFDYTQIPHLTKQKGGFPPNFVHSLDSTHMMMTSLRCEQERMTFASVHDSYWTHAWDVDKMNKFCREEFVALHQLPILDELKKHFDQSYAGLKLRKPLKDGKIEAKFGELPKKGGFDIEKVLDSVYFFS